MRQGTGARHKEALMPRPTPPTANARHQPDAPRTATSPTSPSAANQPSGEPAEYGPADFPGCEAFHLPASELEGYEGRIEFWEARTETAWKVREPTTIYHERPARRLGRLAERIESLRGSRIDSFGSADLARFDAAGNKLSLLQADEALYLHPRRSRVPGRRSTWTMIPCRTWSLRWTTRRTCGGASSGSTRRGAFRRCGCSCRRSPGCARPGSTSTSSGTAGIGRRRRAPHSRDGGGMISTSP